MKIRQLALLAALMLGLAPLASAQRSSHSSYAHRSNLTVQANLGQLGIRLGFGGHSPVRAALTSRYVSSRSCAPTRVWVEGYYRTEYQRVWIEACQQKRWVPPQYATRYDSCGKAYSVLVRDGYYDLVTIPAHAETRPIKVWVPGRYEYRR